MTLLPTASIKFLHQYMQQHSVHVFDSSKFKYVTYQHRIGVDIPAAAGIYLIFFCQNMLLKLRTMKLIHQQ